LGSPSEEGGNDGSPQCFCKTESPFPDCVRLGIA
jgi:hypothetical protein